MNCPLLLQQSCFKQVGGFLGQDERCGQTRLQLLGIFHQFVCIGSNKGYLARLDINKNAVHHRAQLAIGRSKDCFINAINQHIGIHIQLHLSIRQHRNRGVAQTRQTGNRDFARCPNDFDFPGCVVDFDGQRLLRKLLERIQHTFVGCSYNALALDAIHLNLTDEGSVEVRSGDLKGVALQLKQEVVENGQCVFAADNLTRCRKHRQKGRT